MQGCDQHHVPCSVARVAGGLQQERLQRFGTRRPQHGFIIWQRLSCAQIAAVAFPHHTLHLPVAWAPTARKQSAVHTTTFQACNCSATTLSLPAHRLRLLAIPPQRPLPLLHHVRKLLRRPAQVEANRRPTGRTGEEGRPPQDGCARDGSGCCKTTCCTSSQQRPAPSLPWCRVVCQPCCWVPTAAQPPLNPHRPLYPPPLP
jgi:hypothetical protein